jgi:hypothetical protein
MDADVEKVLAGWIELALSPEGKLPEGTTPAQWITTKFLRWWRKDFEGQLDDALGDAENALASIRQQLQDQGGWDKYGEALHECIHLSDALGTIRSVLFPPHG